MWWRSSRPNRTRKAVSTGAGWSREPASASTHGKTSTTKTSTGGTSFTFPRHLPRLEPVKRQRAGPLEADLGVVGVAGLGASANLLGPHPVTLH
ncbi:hypothetical protein EYF80_044286 [Liparis tanakae]|uniref:Uncharacterized protein n=1 Tax=Liparis tanakae TaxID=230148 RepID=A0A4Z2FYS8_9TELE|nr:hypothetical protein EYF80_044286 [Liparis tanakae]